MNGRTKQEIRAAAWAAVMPPTSTPAERAARRLARAEDALAHAEAHGTGEDLITATDEWAAARDMVERTAR